jgi:predicted esterase
VIRWLWRGVAAVALVCVAIAVGLGVHASWSVSGWTILAACALGAAAAFVNSARRRRSLQALAAAALLVLLIVRLAAARGPHVTMPTLPGGTSSRWLGRLVDEQDVSLLGARALIRRWPVTHDERERLPQEMRAAYGEMRAAVGTFPSPVLNTLVRRQAPSGFDALVFEPRGGPSGAAVVFLHGFGGSFALECGLVAEAAQAIGAFTVCPATGIGGHWAGGDGERIVRATLDYVHARGIHRIYLAGLSNGAAGASALAPRFASSLAGLVLISGAPASGTDASLPTLVVHGEHDRVASASAARAFATRNHARYAGFDGGHFVLLMRREETRAAIADWLTRREAAVPRPAP